MCGIAGVYSFERNPAHTAVSRLERMAGALGHRGPDGDGWFVDPGHETGLAHRRLSIIDLEGGRQPIANEDGAIQVVFNGEIFNYIELRDDLEQRGHRFQTRTDTEVLAHLYEERGDDFVSALNGQFAIALWDSRKRRLLLVRDRPGILPLYYAQRPDELLFASEMKAILAALPAPPPINPDALRQIMTLWAPLSPDTIFDGILEVEPGQMVAIDRHGVTKRTYWRWAPAACGETLTGCEPERAEELLALLDDATRIRLRADVPVGAYLSGGLDSSVLTALAARRIGGNLRTFSIGFDDRAFDETSYQRRMIDFLKADHSQIQCRAADITRGLPDVVRATETPLVRTAAVPMHRLSGHVRESGFKVVLTGEGADEALGGYDLFKETKIRAFCTARPASAWRALLLKRLYPYLDFTRAQPVSVLKSYFGALDQDSSDPAFSHQTRWAAGPWCEGLLTPEFRERFRQPAPAALAIERLGAALAPLPLFHRAQLLEARTLLPGYLLASQGDRMLMSHSVEGRFPFLDHRVIEFANRLDPRLKMRVLNEKALLKRAAGGLVPPSILTRPKQPYRAPDAMAFLGPDRPEYFDDLLGTPAVTRTGCFDAGRVDRLTRKLEEAVRRAQPISHRDSLAWMTILTTQMWHHIFQGKP